jgi:protease I
MNTARRAEKNRNHKPVAVVVADDFEDSELLVPLERLEGAGFSYELVGVESGKTLTGKKGQQVVTDKAIDEVASGDYRALLIPGGYSPDQLRTNEKMVSFVRDFCDADKPVAAICHGPQLLIEAEAVKGKNMTSWLSVKTDLVNAGALWVDKAVVEDGSLITSRKPDDLEAFCSVLIAQLESVN